MTRHSPASSLADYLNRRIIKRDGCWEWIGKHDRRGYGRCSRSSPGTEVQAHRAVYKFMVGPIPADLELDHLCRNTGCVNPAHLQPVSHRINVLRGEGPSAQNARKTHCVNGHLFTAANTYVYMSHGRRHRTCRACNRAAQARRKTRIAQGGTR